MTIRYLPPYPYLQGFCSTTVKEAIVGYKATQQKNSIIKMRCALLGSRIWAQTRDGQELAMICPLEDENEIANLLILYSDTYCTVYS